MNQIDRQAVLVVGMHRSGTSSIAGVVHAAGLALPADNVTGRLDNPEHNESLVLSDLNELILAGAGGRWSAPPVEARLGDPSSLATRWGRRSAKLFTRAFPADLPVVWKDPRLSLLFGHWSGLLRETAVVYVWRSPAAVAASLHARDGLPPALAFALWEDYVRRGLQAISGVPTLVLSYEESVHDPGRAFESVVRFAEGLSWGVQARVGVDPAALLRREEPPRSDGEDALLPSQLELMDLLRGLEGSHERFEQVGLGLRSPESVAVLEEHRVRAAEAERRRRRRPAVRIRTIKRRLTGDLSLP